MRRRIDRAPRSGAAGSLLVVTLATAAAVAALLWRRSRLPTRPEDDNVVADRVRTELGPLLQRLDLPRVHVMVEHGVARLHGDVATPLDAIAIEQAVQRVQGVGDVASRLHVGLLASDTRPSQGRRVPSPPSRLKGHLRDACLGAGVEPERADVLVAVTLAAFTARLPDGERQHLVAHLPEDVRHLISAVGDVAGVEKVRTPEELVALVQALVGLPDSCDHAAVRAILGEIRRTVPEETADVVAVLPRDLRALWSPTVQI